MEAGISVCRGLVSSMTQTVVADLVALVQFVAFVRAAMGGDKSPGVRGLQARGGLERAKPTLLWVMLWGCLWVFWSLLA